MFDQLSRSKEPITSEFGAELSWERLDNRKACRIACYSDGGIADSEEELVEYRNWMIGTLSDLKRAIQGPLERAVADATAALATK